MSTRCTVTVRDTDNAESFTVYRHYDGNPETVLAGLKDALSYAWPLPRFEADDFAAAIVAAWKQPGYNRESLFAGSEPTLYQGGNIRLMSGGRDSCGDSSFHYDVRLDNQPGGLRVTVEQRIYGDPDTWKTVKSVRLTAKHQAKVPLKPRSKLSAA